MKYAKWKYRFMHNRLREEGYKPMGLFQDKTEGGVYVGLYSKGKSIVHIEDWIKKFQEFVESRGKG